MALKLTTSETISKKMKPKFRRTTVLVATAIALIVGVIVLWPVTRKQEAAVAPSAARAQPVKRPIAGGTVTNIYAHNLRLHQGPSFRVYVRWLRGQMKPQHKGVNPSFDDPESFYLNVTNGVLRANLGDICNVLNAKSVNAPLRDIQLSGSGDQVKITGKFHKLVSVPVELMGTLKPAGNNRIQMHISKINLLKIPFKSLLGDFHVTLGSLMSSGKIPGLEVSGNDLYFNTEELLPAPHIRGSLTKVSIESPDLEAVYGDVREDMEKVEQWRNFLRLRDGTVDFGKLTMNKVDLVMIDISQDAWFDLDLANYQTQLVNGYTRMTPQAGLQIFMPDVSNMKPSQAKEISIEWFKDRNAAPPDAVVPEKK